MPRQWYWLRIDERICKNAIEKRFGVYASDLFPDFYSELCQFMCW